MTDQSPPPAPPPWRDRIDLLTQAPALSPARVGAAVVGVVAVLLAGWLLLRTPTRPPTEDVLPVATESTATSLAPAPSTVVVHAAGAVVRPGVYELPGGSRVKDLIDAAGGPAADADLDRLNLAAPVADGARVYVPRVGEAVPAGGPDGADDGPLDLNTATLEQLDALPGVGPATARAIVEERTRRGRFTSVDELLDVRGIGPAKLEALRDLVRV